MKTILATLAALTLPTLATADPVQIRERLMDSNAAAAAVSAGMMKDQIPYSPAVAKAAIQAFAATSAAYGSFFPEGSGGGDSAAAPAIWEDPAGWQAMLDKLSTATNAALEASGRSGPADKAAFVAAVGPILETCNSCHETYRLKR